ncbi:MAG: S8 family peptidase [Fimbriimonadaceae bacterium]
MKRFCTLLSVSLGIVAIGSAQLAEHVPGQIHVKFKPNLGAPTMQALHAAPLNYHEGIGVTLVDLPDGMTVSQGLAAFRARSEVVYAEPNYIARAHLTPNDPLFGQMYGLPKIQCPQAWDLHFGSSTIKVADIDTGVDMTHPDLQNNKFAPGYDFANDDSDPTDDHGHGTHTTGTIAANGNNAVGVIGVAPNVTIIPIKVLAASGGGTYDMIIGGIKFGADNGASVLSMSLGGSGASQAMQDALVYALGKGALPVASAGNNGDTNLNYPAAYDECIAVAATDANDQRAGFSTYGDWVEVAAPGVDILSTTMGGGYGLNSGTSMSCPHVAGLAGLIKSADPTLTPAQIRTLIQNNCDPVGNFVTKGRINAFRAMPLISIGQPYTLAPDAVGLFEGSSFIGNLAALLTSNNVYTKANSVFVNRLGHVASQSITIDNKITTSNVVNLSKVVSMDLKMEVAAKAGTTVSLFYKNPTTNAWTFVKSSPMTATDGVVTVKLGSPFTKYFASGASQWLIRGIDPQTTTHTALPFTLRVDKVSLSGMVKN